MLALQAFLGDRLDDQTRLRIKLESPLGVADQAHQVLAQSIVEQRRAVSTDVQTVAHLEAQIQQFATDMRRDVAGHRAGLVQAISEAELRGLAFFDEHIRILNLHRLLRGDALQQAFEQEVAADLAATIEARSQELVDWMIERNLQVWQGVGDYLRRHTKPSDQLIGDGAVAFAYNRQALIRDIVATAGDIVAGYDRSVEAAHVASELRSAVAATAVVQVGAVGVGALIATLLKGAIFDTTGVIAASVIALGGLYIIPNRRATLKRQLRERLADVRLQLVAAIDRQFEQELTRMIAVAPYARLVAAEVARLDAAEHTLATLRQETARIRAGGSNVLATMPTPQAPSSGAMSPRAAE
jgi:hypothetical protein